MDAEREKEFDDDELGVLDDEDSIDWLEHFTAEAPTLNLSWKFYSASDAQQVRLSQEAFNKKLSWCLNECMVGGLPDGMIAALYKMAVGHNQQLTAYSKLLKTLEGAEFNKTLRFVQAELKRVCQISEVLELQKESSLSRRLLLPQEMFEWDNVWIASLRELVRSIKKQLESCEQELVKQHQFWLNLGRTKIETHLLETAMSTIVTQLKDHKFRLDNHCVLVAYAHAAKLVPYIKSDGKYASVEAMKMRMCRARKSKNRVAMLSLFLAQLVVKAR